MSLLAELQPKAGSTHRRKRLGRGDASGKGGTSGHGHKGQTARSGGRIRRGFEGGQTPLSRRSPKLGFKNTNFKTVYTVVNLDKLVGLTGEINPATLVAKGIARAGLPVKVLAKGKIDKALTIKANKFSEAAKAAIEAAGGKAELI
jgi:large subunit ribosomal protein L15